MNREYKHHNPKLYKPIMETLIKELGNNWKDVCYGNDLVASIAFDEIKIFLPNSKVHDEDKEEFNNFVIMDYENLEVMYDLKTIEEVIKKIKEIEK